MITEATKSPERRGISKARVAEVISTLVNVLVGGYLIKEGLVDDNLWIVGASVISAEAIMFTLLDEVETGEEFVKRFALRIGANTIAAFTGAVMMHGVEGSQMMQRAQQVAGLATENLNPILTSTPTEMPTSTPSPTVEVVIAELRPSLNDSQLRSVQMMKELLQSAAAQRQTEVILEHLKNAGQVLAIVSGGGAGLYGLKKILQVGVTKVKESIAYLRRIQVKVELAPPTEAGRTHN